MEKIKNLISENARNKMKTEIELAGGNEVFFRGLVDDNLMVEDVMVVARGNKYSVPAIMAQMKKQEVIIHNHPSGYLYPSDNDVSISSLYGEKYRGGSYIINNDVDDIYVVVELIKEEIKKIDIDEYFSPDGLLKTYVPGYEYRDEQKEMALHIQNGINNEKKSIVEAGTGTGKTLAYLIPSIVYSILNGKKTIISTNTINLQEQLMSKDLPIISKILKDKFSYVLVKGRGNYLCLRKADKLSGEDLNDMEISESQIMQLKTILEWSKISEHGDRGELHFEVDGFIWELFNSESDLCLGVKCGHRDNCFFYKARAEVMEADLLITNHHIYFADLSIRKEAGFITDYSILPNYDMVVFDEAHNIEKVARDYFSYEASKYSFIKVMNSIYRKKKSGRRSALDALKSLFQNIKPRPDQFKDIILIIENEIKEKHDDLHMKGADYYLALMKYFCEDGNAINKRLRKEQLESDPTWADGIVKREKEFISSYINLMQSLRKLIKLINELDDEFGVITEFVKYVDRLDGFFINFKFITKFEDDNYIYWISANMQRNRIKLVATPLKIDNELNENLYKHLEQIIFTSATLAIDHNFKYFKNSIGLKESCNEAIIDSPFNYDKQMKVYIPKDIPLPNERSFLNEIGPLIKRLINLSRGNTFLLFTSYYTLNYLYYFLRDDLEDLGYDLFIQGQAPRNKLLTLYKNSDKPVLFGTDSFWEGVDVKGEKLTSVIMIKLPFKVPSEPVVEAIIENMEKEGKNPFMEYQIPESVIKFKQGIGRLIRSKNDKGIITILDGRLIKKAYGKIFINSLPTKNIKFPKMDDFY